MAKKSAPELVLIEDICDVFNNHWPSPDFYQEDTGDAWETEVKYDGKGVCRPKKKNENALVDLRAFDCYLAWQGAGEEDRDGVPDTFVELFWSVKKKRTHTRLVLDVPNEKVEEFRKLAAALGARAPE